MPGRTTSRPSNSGASAPRTAEAAEQRAWEEITATPFFSQIARHDLSDFELGELRADLVRCSAVSRAWLVRKNLREFPWRRAYVLFVELPCCPMRIAGTCAASWSRR